MTLEQEVTAEGAESGPSRPPRRRISRATAVVLIALAVLVSGVAALLAHAVAGAGAGPSVARAAATATTVPATATPVLNTVYTADWTTGPAGWTLPQGWHTSGGALVVDALAVGSATVPYVATSARYQIEMAIDVQAVGTGPDGGHRGSYGLVATNAHGDPLWNVKALCFARPEPSCVGNLYSFTASLGTYQPGAGGAINASDFASGTGVQTYLVDVSGQSLGFCVSDDCLADSASGVPLAPAHLAFSAANVRVVLSQFVVRVP